MTFCPGKDTDWYRLHYPRRLRGLCLASQWFSGKHGLNIHAGLIDSDYRGEIHVCLINHGDKMVEIYTGDKIAQLVVSPITLQAEEVKTLDNTSRGVGGFGSTGK